MQEYLRATTVIDHETTAILVLASQLSTGLPPNLIVERCFNWVRDEIRHSIDHGDRCVTLTASEVLHNQTGLCYAKSHLLAALLRANGIPCGFAYQRLATDESGTRFCLHGLNAVWLTEFGWYRIDPRGNRIGISTAFDPPVEHFAFATRQPGEYTINQIFSDPLPFVISSLSKYDDVIELCQNLPDWLGERCSESAPQKPPLVKS